MFKIVITRTDYTTGRSTKDGVWHRRYKSRKTAEKVAADLGYVVKGEHGGECSAHVIEVTP